MRKREKDKCIYIERVREGNSMMESNGITREKEVEKKRDSGREVRETCKRERERRLEKKQNVVACRWRH